VRRDEMEMRFWLLLHRFCARFVGHRWGAVKRDEILGWSRTCRFCRVARSVPVTTATFTSGNATTSLTHITMRVRP
jgi:hypothetical protein